MFGITTRRRSFAFGILLVVGLTVGSGILQGRIRNRWGLPEVIRTAAEKLCQIPAQFGTWQLRSKDTLDQATIEILEGSSYFAAQYANSQTGEVVRVLLLVGPQGPLSVHTPEICYPSHEYVAQGAKQRVTLPHAGRAADQFWSSTFRPSRLSGGLERVYYAWTAGRNWSAPEDPRFANAGKAYLYKIQVSSSLPPGASAESPDPCLGFLGDFLPVAAPYLIASSAE